MCAKSLAISFAKYFPGGSDGKVSVYNAGDPSSILGSGRSLGEGNGNPLQYDCLENPMDRGACRLQWGRKESDTTEQFHFQFNPFLSLWKPALVCLSPIFDLFFFFFFFF